jgi:putative heme iron utilization protein
MLRFMTKEGAENPGGSADQALRGAEARGLIRRASKAALATVGSAQGPAAEAKSEGWPANALVTVAAACDGAPILLLSTLAHHTRNILADPRASLLIEATGGFVNPQAGPRVTVFGRIVENGDPGLRRRFLARHPAAKMYAGFGDFAVYRMAIERLHYVGGFARARWIECADAVFEGADEIAAAEEDILAHMNADHAETLSLYAQRLLKLRVKRVELVAVDPEGFDLRSGRTMHRLDFPSPAKTLDQIRAAFVALAQQAREPS